MQRYPGGTNCHDLDLMSLDSNAQRDKQGNPLRHFTPYPTPKSSGVNVFNQDLSVCDGNRVNAYVFLPFALVGPILRFIASEKVVAIMVVSKMSPFPGWWPLMNVLAPQKSLGFQERVSRCTLFPFKTWLCTWFIPPWTNHVVNSPKGQTFFFQSLPIVPKLF